MPKTNSEKGAWVNHILGDMKAFHVFEPAFIKGVLLPKELIRNEENCRKILESMTGKQLTFVSYLMSYIKHK